MSLKEPTLLILKQVALTRDKETRMSAIKLNLIIL